MPPTRFYLRLLRCARVRLIDEPLLNFRYTPDQDDHRRMGTAQRGEGDQSRMGSQTVSGESWEARETRRAILPRISLAHPEPRGIVKLRGDRRRVADAGRDCIEGTSFRMRVRYGWRR